CKVNKKKERSKIFALLLKMLNNILTFRILWRCVKANLLLHFWHGLQINKRILVQTEWRAKLA
ncbi:MAG: hypothetical protein J6C10_01990, partial [Prevotella sp.]|nr:hypothetical protein [Prevotella sp.]